MQQNRSANAVLPGPMLWICWALSCLVLPDPLRADAAIITAPLAFCSQNDRSISLSDDRNVLCFDGLISDDIALEKFYSLNIGGMLVIRSGGGNIIRAMQIADILLEKRAGVIIHDYCLSACANAILVAPTTPMLPPTRSWPGTAAASPLSSAALEFQRFRWTSQPSSKTTTTRNIAGTLNC